MWNFLHSWQRLVLLRRTDADVPCSIVDYDWYRSNWVAVTLLRLCWTPQPDWSLLLSESLGQAGGSWWKKTEQPQQPIKEHQLHPFESFMISIVFTPPKKNCTETNHILSAVLFFLTSSPSWTWRLLLPGKTWTKMSSSAFVRLSLSCPSNRCLWMSHPSCVLEQILRGSNDC